TPGLPLYVEGFDHPWQADYAERIGKSLQEDIPTFPLDAQQPTVFFFLQFSFSQKKTVLKSFDRSALYTWPVVNYRSDEPDIHFLVCIPLTPHPRNGGIYGNTHQYFVQYQLVHLDIEIMNHVILQEVTTLDLIHSVFQLLAHI